MNFKHRYILTVTVNVLSMLAFFAYATEKGWDLTTRRLADLNLFQKQDQEILLSFATLLLVVGITNFLLLARSNTTVRVADQNIQRADIERLRTIFNQ